MTTPQELVLDINDLMSLPEIYLRIRDVINNPASTLNNVSDVVSQDANITARVLRITNSSFFGFAEEITTLSRAINIMGFSQLQDLVLSVSVVRSFKGVPNELINMKEFWTNSVFCAVTARLLAARCNVLDSERLFVSGLLHGIGQLIIYSKLPNETTEILTLAKQQNKPVKQVERHVLGFDYAQVGGELLKAWKLPESHIEAVGSHTDLRSVDKFALDAAIIHIASVLVQQYESAKKGYGIPQFDPIALQLTELTEADIDPIKQDATHNILEVLRLLFSK
ncbi:MAG: HDOD domain-containing protein [Methylococcales bacterium]|nr:HDOD domain-containing protein [Methylococcales bacterium]